MADLRPSIPDILSQALELPEADRPAFLAAACQGDDRFLLRVQQLLAAHPQAADWLETPAIVATIAADDTLGDLIGPYKLLEQIGEGGMGLVYMAEQQRPLKRLVALKIIKPGMDSRQVIARFEAERQALAMMDHPNIAKVLDAGTAGPVCRTGPEFSSDLEAQGPARQAGPTGRPFFVMELVRGIPITEFCDQTRLTTLERLELMVQVCQAVQHAHQKGIIHRDLKPSNILVTMNDATPLPKVIDFGIAKALGQSLTDHTLHTGFAQLVGTPLYMSPEQASLSHLGVDTRSDVYSLGVLLYELLTGTTPFDKETLTKAGLDEMRRIIREDEPLRPSARVSTLNAQALSTVSTRRNTDPRRISIILRGELDWIVMKALEKDRSRRYESPSTLAADIQRYLFDEPVHACPPSILYRFRKFTRKHKTTFNTIALLAASLLLGTIVSVWQAIRATQAEAQANANEAQAVGAAAAEATQRQRAEASEQEAQSRLVEVERQRKQADKNFAAALEAVDRMLTHVDDPELNDIPRVGPLRRKILKDAVAFYERIPLQRDVSAQVQMRVAQTWRKIASLSWSLNENEQTRQAFTKAISILTQLVAHQPSNANYRATLASYLSVLGKYYQDTEQDFAGAEKALRRASELYAELAHNDPQEKSWLIRQAETLSQLARALNFLGKRDEGVGYCARALNLLDLSQVASSFDRAQVLFQMANLAATDAERDEYSHRALAEYRKFFVDEKQPEQYPGQYAGRIWAIASNLTQRYPDEAEKLLDQSITLWSEIAGPSPSLRNYSLFLVKALRDQARHQRRLAADRAATENPDQIAGRVTKAETLLYEAIRTQRQMVSRFALREDRSGLIQMLQEEAEYLLGQLGKPSATEKEKEEDASARKLQADALLTEAIQLCRQLTAEFPKNTTYSDHFAALLKLQAQHFGATDAGQAALQNH